MREGSGERYIGRRVPRREDDRLLRGLGHFLDDVAEPPGTCHLAFVRSPHAHARIQGIDATAAAALPGVVAVLVGAEVNALAKPMCPDYDQPGYKVTERTVMAVELARFVGDAVAVVVAESAYIAEDAVELVELHCEPLSAVIDLDAALAPGALPVHEHAGDNVLYNASFATEGFEEAFAASQRQMREAVNPILQGWLAELQAEEQEARVAKPEKVDELCARIGIEPMTA